MKRPKKVQGLCGRYFIQDDPIINREIHLTCEYNEYWIRTSYNKSYIQDEINSVCKVCDLELIK